MLNEDIFKRLLHAQRSLNINEWARRLELNKNTISDILNDKIQNPGILVLAKIADALNCSVDELISDDCKKPIPFKAALARSCVNATIEALCQAKECAENQSAEKKRTPIQKVSFDELLSILKAIYAHSLEQKLKTADIAFATQCINDFLRGQLC